MPISKNANSLATRTFFSALLSNVWSVRNFITCVTELKSLAANSALNCAQRRRSTCGMRTAPQVSSPRHLFCAASNIQRTTHHLRKSSLMNFTILTTNSIRSKFLSFRNLIIVIISLAVRFIFLNIINTRVNIHLIKKNHYGIRFRVGKRNYARATFQLTYARDTCAASTHLLNEMTTYNSSLICACHATRNCL